jgi:hypothetical protein
MIMDRTPSNFYEFMDPVLNILLCMQAGNKVRTGTVLRNCKASWQLTKKVTRKRF